MFVQTGAKLSPKHCVADHCLNLFGEHEAMVAKLMESLAGSHTYDRRVPTDLHVLSANIHIYIRTYINIYVDATVDVSHVS